MLNPTLCMHIISESFLLFNISVKTCIAGHFRCGKSKRTPLHYAAAVKDRANVIEKLIGAGAVIDIKDKFTMSPLLLSCMINSAENVNALITNKAHVQIKGIK